MLRGDLCQLLPKWSLRAGLVEAPHHLNNIWHARSSVKSLKTISLGWGKWGSALIYTKDSHLSFLTARDCTRLWPSDPDMCTWYGMVGIHHWVNATSVWAKMLLMEFSTTNFNWWNLQMCLYIGLYLYFSWSESSVSILTLYLCFKT